MKTLLCCLLGMLLLGCAREASPTAEKRLIYPALNESPPPPAPPVPKEVSTQPWGITETLPSVITGERWIDDKAQTDDMVNRLRAYSEKADPDDPFALKESEIQKLSEQEGIRIY